MANNSTIDNTQADPWQIICNKNWWHCLVKEKLILARRFSLVEHHPAFMNNLLANIRELVDNVQNADKAVTIYH